MLTEMGRSARAAFRQVAKADSAVKNETLRVLATLMEQVRDEIISANNLDLEAARSSGMNDALIDRLDFSAFEARYRGGGRPAYPPRLICKLLIYGCSRGVRSSRELSRLLERDHHYMWLAHGMRIDHEVFSDLRQDFRDLFTGIFEQTVLLAASVGRFEYW